MSNEPDKRKAVESFVPTKLTLCGIQITNPEHIYIVKLLVQKKLPKWLRNICTTKKYVFNKFLINNMCVCVYVCMCVCVCVCVYVYVYVHVYVYVYVYMYICVCICVCVYVYVYVNVCMFICVFISCVCVPKY